MHDAYDGDADDGTVDHGTALDANRLAAFWAVLDEVVGRALGPRSQAQAALLLTLSHWAPTTVGELASVVGLSQPACSRALDRLADDGLVDRSTYRGREARVVLTAEGSAAAAELQHRRLAAADRLLGRLTGSERAVLGGLLETLMAGPVDGRATARRLCRFCAHDRCGPEVCPIGAAAEAADGSPPPARSREVGP